MRQRERQQPMIERMMKPGISAEKERDTEAGTLLITQCAAR